MLPVTLNLARERGIPPSKRLMPLSFAASLGTTITIIGAPAFLIACHVLQQAGRPGLGIFSLAPIGLSLSLVGTAFMLLAGRFLLHARTGVKDPTQRFRLTEYFTEVTILPNSPFLDKTAATATRCRYGPPQMQTLLVNSRMRRQAVFHTRFESQRDQVHSSGDTYSHGIEN